MRPGGGTLEEDAGSLLPPLARPPGVHSGRSCTQFFNLLEGIQELQKPRRLAGGDSRDGAAVGQDDFPSTFPPSALHSSHRHEAGSPESSHTESRC